MVSDLKETLEQRRTVNTVCNISVNKMLLEQKQKQIYFFWEVGGERLPRDSVEVRDREQVRISRRGDKGE